MRNLLGRLLERTPTDLDRIATHWDVDLRGRDRYSDVAAIYRTMTDIWAARDAWAAMDAPQRRMIQTMLRLDDGPQPPAALAHMSELDADVARDALRQLFLIGVVAVDDDAAEQYREDNQPAELFLPRELAAVFQRILDEQDVELRDDLKIDELLAIPVLAEMEDAAARWGARVTPGLQTRAELVNVLRNQLTRPEHVERLVRNLSGNARDLWLRLRDAGGQLPLSGVLPAQRSAQRRRAIQELTAPLLAWHQYREGEDGTKERWLIIPNAILRPEKPETTPPPALRSVDPDDVLEADWVFPQSLAWDLLTVMREVVVSEPRWNALVEDNPTIARRFRGKLWRSDRESGTLPTGYIPFLVAVGAHMGVLQDIDGRAGPGPAAQDWRKRAFTTAQREAVQAWARIETWVEGQSRVDVALYGASWPAYRQTLLESLGQLEPDIWYDEASFIDRLLQSEPDLLRQAQVGAAPRAQLSMRIEDGQRPTDSRLETMRLIVATTLSTAGIWLNLIERSQKLEDGEAVLRLTPFGHWITARGAEPVGQHLGPAPLGVGANFQILLYRPTPRRVWALSAFSELQALDRVSTYILTAPALIRALAGGVNLSDVVKVLESLSGQDLPQTVTYTLEEWDRGYRRVWLNRAVVLTPEEGEDSNAIARALRDAGLEPEILEDGRILLSSETASASERLYTAAAHALRDRGFAPLTDQDAVLRRDRKGS